MNPGDKLKTISATRDAPRCVHGDFGSLEDASVSLFLGSLSRNVSGDAMGRMAAEPALQHSKAKVIRI